MWCRKMEDPVEETIRSLQISVDSEKARLELDFEVRKFIDLLLLYPEALTVLFQWTRQPKPFIIVSPAEFNYAKLKSHMLDAVQETRYIREFAYSLISQYSEAEDNARIVRINEFLGKASEAEMLDVKKEIALLCFECGSIVVTNAIDKIGTCTCGSPFDVRFRIATISEKISRTLTTGHLLELLALRIMRNVKQVKLIGMEFEKDGKENKVYTSIQYAGIGVGDKENGELDVVGVKDDRIVAIECKFNETSHQDIDSFLGVSEKLYFKARERCPSIKKVVKVVFSYDGSKLKTANGFFVFSLKNLLSTDELTRSISKILA